MFQGSTFRPSAAEGFMPAVQLQGTRLIQAQRSQGFYPSVRMGQDTQTAQAWFERAKKALERYETLKSRSALISDKTARETVLAGLGKSDVAGSPENRYMLVKDDFTGAVAQEGVGAFNVESRQKRVSDLEAYNDQFGAKVDAAVKTYGIDSAPATTENPDMTVPILIGAGAITLALLLS